MESLFVYGTLAPGRANTYMLEEIGGTWEEGYVFGTLLAKGWGAGLGFPGIILDEQGSRVEGFVFFSEHLADYWDALDAFEGDDYIRVPVDVSMHDGRIVSSSIYMLKSEASER